MVDRPEVFLGRQRELAEIGAWLESAVGGRIVLVAGEAGIGKSRLVREAVTAHRGPVVWSSCWEGDGVPPFWPWIPVIRTCLAPPGGERWRAVGDSSDEASISAARKHAAEADVADRTRFELWDASKGGGSAPAAGRFDLVVAIEMVHDVPDPVGILSTMRDLRADGGEVLVVDERVADVFTVPGDEMERFMYAASVLHCLPVGMVDDGSAATGTVIRSSIVRDYAARAGFRGVDVLGVDHAQFRLYRLEG